MVTTVRVRALSSGPALHFFCYYGICPWDATGRRHLAVEVDHDTAPPGPEDAARVGWLADGVFTAVAQTRAWNFQQGAMLHWLPDGSLLHNDWEGDRVVARVHAPDGTRRTLERAVAGLAPDGYFAIGLDYRRNYRCRTVVGYAHHHDGAPVVERPADDGLWCIDVATGQTRLGLSVAELCEREPRAPVGGAAWLDHVVFSPSGHRILFFCRVVRPDGGWWSSLWTADADGGNPRCQIGYKQWVSHFAWLDDERLLISTDLLGERGFIVFRDGHTDFARFAPGLLPDDGHACLSPDGRWIVCDTYPRGPDRTSRLMLVDAAGTRRIDLAAEDHPPRYQADLRCDLHPRWDRSGSFITIDSLRGGSRQVQRIDLPC